MALKYNEIVQEVYSLDTESKKELLELLEKNLIEEARDDLLVAAKSAQDNLKKGKIKSGIVSDLLADLND